MGANAKRVLVGQLGVVASLGRLNGDAYSSFFLRSFKPVFNLNADYMEIHISHHQFY